MRTCSRRFMLVCCALSTPVFVATPGSAINRNWDDGGADLNWSNQFNWDPNGSPASDDLFIGNLPAAANDQTIVNIDYVIDSLTLSNGADADTDGNFLDINGDLTLSNAGTTMIVDEHSAGAGTTALEVQNVTINNGGELRLTGGRVVSAVPGPGNGSAAVIDINTGGEMSGYGTLRFQDGGFTGSLIQMVNDGVLSTRRGFPSSVAERFTLTIETSDTSGNPRLDLDGNSNSGVINVVDNTTLALRLEEQAFAGTLNLEPGAIMDVNFDWTQSDGKILVDADSVFAGVPDNARFRGGDLALTGTTAIEIDSGTFIVEQELTDGPNTTIGLAANTGIRFEGDASIEGAFNLGIGSTVTVAGAILNVTRPSDWVVTRNLVMDTTTGSTRIQTSGGLNLEGGDLTVIGGDVALHDDPVAFGNGIGVGATTEVFVDADTEMRFLQGATFNFNVDMAGDGMVSFSNGTITVNNSLDVDMQNGIVLLEGSSAGNTNIELNDDLALNVMGLNTSGTNTFGSGTNNEAININNANTDLTINLTTPGDEWTLSPRGTINITGSTGTIISQVAGSDLNVEGAIVVNDSSRISARIDLEGPGAINIATAGGRLELAGGTTTDANRINGGLITGAGELRTFGSGKRLIGHGTISVDVRFVNGGDLFADGGTLIVNNPILEADEVGTIHPTGVLDLRAPLDTGNITRLEINGGEVTGVNDTITNNGETSGHGMITTQGFINNGLLIATGGPTELIIDTVNAPDLDGAGTSGEIQVIAADMTVVDAPADFFGGLITIGQAQTLTMQGGWTLGSNGTLHLDASAPGSSSAELAGGITDLRGTVNVTERGLITAPTVFRSNVIVNLPVLGDELELDNDSEVEFGATFSGGGLLENLAGNVMQLHSGVDMQTALSNEGTLVIGSSPGQVTVERYTHQPGATVEIELGGTGTNDVDRLLADTDIVLSGGTLEVTLINGFEPEIGDRFNILTALFGTISGDFDQYVLPTLQSPLSLVPHFPQHGAALDLVVSFPGDFDFDGDVDLSDFNILAANFTLSGPGVQYQDGDADYDNDVDLADFNILAANFGLGTSESVGALPSAASLPEPGVALLIVVGLPAMAARRSRGTR